MRKLIWMIWGISILCAAPSVKAAQVKEVKTTKFSLLELGEKISTIVLKKYPEAHVSNAEYRVSACTATFAEDSRKGPQSCLDYRVQPRPDSTDFKLQMFCKAEHGHYYRPVFKKFVKSSDNASEMMEQHFNIRILPDPQKPPVLSKEYFNSEVPDIPNLHWLYDDWYQLEQADVPNPMLGHQISFYKPATRYEFAVAIARLLDQKEKRTKDSPKVKAIIADLTFEFEPDLIHLGVPVDHNQIVRDLAAQGIVWQPRYEYLQLNLVYGKKFDKKLRQKIENTIAKYVVHHSDLN